MVAMLAFGGTFALFTAETERKTGSFTTGHVYLTSNWSTLTVTADTDVVPGDTIIDGNISVTPDNLGTATTMAVRVLFRTKKKGTETWGDANYDLSVLNLRAGAALADGWKYDSTNNMYVYGNGTACTPVADKANSAIDFTKADIVFEATSHSTEGEDQASGWMDIDVQLSFQAVSRQVVSGEEYATTLTELAKLFDADAFAA